MKYDSEKIKLMLRRVLVAMETEEKNIDDAIFHMTDWLYDLRKLSDAYENPDSISTKEFGRFLVGFLVHVPPHLAAARKLVTDLPVPDVFGIGATTEEHN